MICSSPFRAKNQPEYMVFPCGKCVACLQRRISNWSARLMAEERVSSSAFFVTFTYDNSSVPISSNGYMTLFPRHLQLFFKKLRKAHKYANVKLKYYAAGEYGSIRSRPHYHVILFNALLPVLVGAKYATQVANGYLDLDGTFQFKCNSWDYGHITVGRVTEASVGYALKYLQKDSRIPLHAKDDRVSEFQRVSKGLGVSYLSPAMVAWHEADLLNRFYMPLKSGQKVSLPRYYKDRLYTQETKQMIGQYLASMVEKENLESSIFPLISRRQYQRLTYRL